MKIVKCVASIGSKGLARTIQVISAALSGVYGGAAGESVTSPVTGSDMNGHTNMNLRKGEYRP